MSCSIHKLKSRMLFTGKNFVFFNFTWKKNLAPGNGGGGREGCLLPVPFVYDPDSPIKSLHAF